eukprot:jgi/Chlat1/8458/Chrsp80S09227
MGQWSTSLLGILDDGPVPCLIAWCVPCVTFGQIAEVANGTGCFAAGCIWYCLAGLGCCCIYSMGVRAAIRTKYGIPGEQGMDAFLGCCVPCLSFAQEQRELKVRGAFGPNGMNAGGAAMAAPQAQHMSAGKPGGY